MALAIKSRLWPLWRSPFHPQGEPRKALRARSGRARIGGQASSAPKRPLRARFLAKLAPVDRHPKHFFVALAPHPAFAAPEQVEIAQDLYVMPTVALDQVEAPFAIPRQTL